MESSKAPRSGGGLMRDIRRALETRDFEALGQLYSEGAVLEEVSSLSPPAHPVIVRGREAIVARLRDDVLRDPISGWERRVKNTTVLDEIETEDGLAFTELRTYEAGDRALAHHMARKRGGKIEHDRVIVAWDDPL